jgi:hypothetical protein
LPGEKREYETNKNNEPNETFSTFSYVSLFSFVSYSLFCLHYCKPRLLAELPYLFFPTVFCYFHFFYLFDRQSDRLLDRLQHDGRPR